MKFCIYKETWPRYEWIKKRTPSKTFYEISMKQIWWNSSIFHISHKLTCDREVCTQPAQSEHLASLRIACLLGKCYKLGQLGGALRDTAANTPGFQSGRDFFGPLWRLWKIQCDFCTSSQIHSLCAFAFVAEVGSLSVAQLSMDNSVCAK